MALPIPCQTWALESLSNLGVPFPCPVSLGAPHSKSTQMSCQVLKVLPGKGVWITVIFEVHKPPISLGEVLFPCSLPSKEFNSLLCPKYSSETWLSGEEEGDRGWDGWMASPVQWTGISANSGRKWRTQKPGILQFMGSQRVRHDLSTEHQQQRLNRARIKRYYFKKKDV